MMCRQISELILSMSCLPGMSQRSATRAVAHMMSDTKGSLSFLQKALEDVTKSVKKCDICWNFSNSSPCEICSGSNKRNRGEICLVEDIGALWGIERRRIYNGMYHVLGGLLSASDNITPSDLNMKNLLNRIATRPNNERLEIIIAMPPSIESGITVEYVVQSVRETDNTVIISRVSQGVPSGTRIESVDDETMAAALLSRVIIT